MSGLPSPFHDWTNEQAGFVIEWLDQIQNEIIPFKNKNVLIVAFEIARNFDWKKGYSEPSIPTICKGSLLQRTTVVKARKELIDRGFIQWSEGDKKTNYRTRHRLAFPVLSEPAAMNRSFERTSINVPNSRPMPAYLICCSKCGVTEKVSSNTHGGAMAPEGVAAKFRNKGWSISSRGNHDICPSCQEKKAKEPAKDSNVIDLIRAEPPRVMGKEDRRVIFSKINDVYMDERTGYAKGWSDKKVSDDLGVPLAWVREIREEHFGVEGLQIDELSVIKAWEEELDKSITAADNLIPETGKIIKDIENLLNKANKLAENAATAHGNLCFMHERLKKIESTINKKDAK